MKKPVDFKNLACRDCMDSSDLGFQFSMAFQPIVRGICRMCRDLA